jgi:uncharacterized protein YkwD
MVDPRHVVDFVCVTRSKAFLVAALLLVVIPVGGATASSAHSGARSGKLLVSLNRQIAIEINHQRRAHGLVPLRFSTQLNASARQHSIEMAKHGYFDHPSADGTAFWQRIQRYYSSRNYSYWTVGENLLFASPDITATAALRQWIRSPEHLRNLLNPSWRNLGISSVHMTHARGVYGGYPTTIITADFGARH